MLLAPSDIHFIKDTTNGILTPDQRTIADLSNRFQESREKIPKIQVAEKDGAWFALNNSYLHIIRELERQGKCPKIRVEVVPLSKVPENVQKGMVVGLEDKTLAAGETGATSTAAVIEEAAILKTEQQGYRVTKQGYYKLPSNNATDDNSHVTVVDPETDGSSSCSSSEYSDYDQDEEEEETESEYDDALTCNVCDRTFNCTRQLAQHQQKKRHFGCSICNSSFPSLLALEHHKESLDHWSEDEGNSNESDSDDDSDIGCSKQRTEEMERLL